MHCLLELPDSIGLLSLRELAPLIGQQRQRHDLNILGMEALAAAIQLSADVYLSTGSPRLEAALQAEGRNARSHDIQRARPVRVAKCRGPNPADLATARDGAPAPRL